MNSTRRLVTIALVVVSSVALQGCEFLDFIAAVFHVAFNPDTLECRDDSYRVVIGQEVELKDPCEHAPGAGIIGGPFAIGDWFTLEGPGQDPVGVSLDTEGVSIVSTTVPGVAPSFRLKVMAPAMPGRHQLSYRYSTAAGGEGFGTLDVEFLSGVADLAVAISAPSQVTAGSNIPYTITITNNGPDAANDVMLSDLLPESEFARLVSAPDCQVGQFGDTLECGPFFLGSGATIQFPIVLNARVALIGALPNTVRVSSELTEDPNPVNNQATALTAVLNPAAHSADFGVAMSAPSQATAGGNLTYTITVSNNGPDGADVSLDDQFSATATLVRATPTQGSCSSSAGDVFCELGPLAKGSSATVTVVVTPAQVGSIVNTAFVLSDIQDPNPANDSATVTTVVVNPTAPIADLAVAVSAAPSVTVGNDLTYTILVTNNGPAAATDIALTSVLQPNVALASISPGCVGQVGGTIACGPLSLASGASTQLTIVVRALVTPTITNTVAVASSTTQDPSPANNTAVVTTTVGSGGADLGITLTSSPEPVQFNRPLTLTVIVTNSGPSDATNVFVTYTPPNTPQPTDIEFASVMSSQGFCSSPSGGARITCSLANLANGATAIVIITGFPVVRGTLTSIATVTANEFDPNQANNTAVATTTVQ